MVFLCRFDGPEPRARSRGGNQSWQEYWLDKIHRREKYDEKPDRYIDYLVRARYDLGLPEVPGYPYLRDESVAVPGTSGVPSTTPPHPVAGLRMADNEQNWRMWTGICEALLDKEAFGVKPRAKSGTWENYWLDRIKRAEQYQDNPKRYVDYLIQARHDRGLPEIPGYPYLRDESK